MLSYIFLLEGMSAWKIYRRNKMLNLMKCCQYRSYILSWTMMHCTEACEHAPRTMLRKKACGNRVQNDFLSQKCF